MIDIKKTGQRIRDKSKEKGLKAKEISEKVGVRKITAYKWMEGYFLPTIDNLLELAHMFGCKIDDLLEEYSDE